MNTDDPPVAEPAPDAQGAAPRPAADGRARRWPRRVGIGLAAVVLLVVLALVVDYLVLASRVGSLPVRLPPTQQGTTWVIVGLDDRSSVAEQTGADVGNGPGAPTGARADIVIVVHDGPAGRGVLTVSRDVLVRTARDEPQRLANTWLGSPQQFVDALCRSVGIPTTHLVSVNMRAFVSLVDAIGGVEVDLPTALRDRKAKVSLPAGRQRVDGRTALGLVRSRQGEVFTGGAWRPEPDGATGRQRRAAQVMQAVLVQARGTSPLRLQRAAWAVTPDIALNEGTRLLDLRRLRSLPAPTALPVDEDQAAALAQLTDESTAALQRAGFTGECTPAR